MTTRKAKYRLRDLDTEEVSMVDRAANKRRFLVAKSEETEMPKEVVQGADGAFTTAGAGSTDTAPTSVAKAGASLTKDQQSALADIFDQMQAALDEARDAAKKAKVVETPEEVDVAAVCDPMSTLCDMAEDACMSLLGADEDGAMPPEPTEGEEMPEPPPMAKSFAIRCAKRTIAKAQVAKGFKGFVQKFGRKMKKDRYDKGMQALQVLSSVFNEVAPMVTEKGKSPPMPPEKVKDQTKKSDDTADQVQKALAPFLDDLKKNIEGMAAVVQKQGTAITALEKSHQAQQVVLNAVAVAKSASNGAVVDGAGTPPEPKFNWGRDINQ